MRNRTILIMAVLFATVLIAIAAGCIDSQQTRTYTVGVDAGLSPWESINTDGEPQGAVIELLNLIAEDQGFTIEYFVPVDGLWQEALENGKIDTEGTIVMTPERKDLYEFVTMPFDPTRYTIITREDSGILLEDVLAGNVSISLFPNSVYEDWAMEQFGDEYPQMVADGRIVLKKYADELAYSVLTGEVDTAIADLIAMSSHLAQYQQLKYIGYVGEPREVGFVLRKNETVLRNLLEAGVQNLQNTTEFQDILDKYSLPYEKDPYIVGIDEDNYPWTQMDVNGHATGYDIEQIEWIAKQKGFNVSFKPRRTDLAMMEVLTGDIDMWTSGTEITPERSEYVRFSDSYYSPARGIAMRNGDIALQELINSGLAEFESSGEQAKVLEKYGI